jgi:FixJ family two-component response regulator
MNQTSSPRRVQRIAVVDDHEPFRKGICTLLAKRGLAVFAYGSAHEFVKSGIIRTLDCLILDIGLPEINGLSLHECLKNTNCDFPIIVCTGQESNQRLEAVKNDGSIILKKPVDFAMLLSTIRSVGLSVSADSEEVLHGSIG